MKPNRWMVAAAVLTFAACSETPMEQPMPAPSYATYDGPVDCVSSCETYSKMSLALPGGGGSIVLGQTPFVGIVVNVSGFQPSKVGKTTFWTARGAVNPESDTFPPGPGPTPNTPIRSIVGKTAMPAFLSMLNAASAVGPASDTFPPGPGPVGAMWRNAAGVVTHVMYVADLQAMQKSGNIAVGDTRLNMLLQYGGSSARTFGTIDGVSIISPEVTVPLTKK